MIDLLCRIDIFERYSDFSRKCLFSKVIRRMCHFPQAFESAPTRQCSKILKITLDQMQDRTWSQNMSARS